MVPVIKKVLWLGVNKGSFCRYQTGLLLLSIIKEDISNFTRKTKSYLCLLKSRSEIGGLANKIKIKTICKGRVQKKNKKNYGKFHIRGRGGGSAGVIFHIQFFFIFFAPNGLKIIFRH